MRQATKQYTVYLLNGQSFSVVNVTHFERLQAGEVRFYGPDGKMSDYFNSVKAVQEKG